MQTPANWEVVPLPGGQSAVLRPLESWLERGALRLCFHFRSGKPPVCTENQLGHERPGAAYAERAYPTVGGHGVGYGNEDLEAVSYEYRYRARGGSSERHLLLPSGSGCRSLVERWEAPPYSAAPGATTAILPASQLGSVVLRTPHGGACRSEPFPPPLIELDANEETLRRLLTLNPRVDPPRAP